MIVIKYRFDSVLEYIFIETIILYAFRLYPSYVSKEMIMMMMVTELERFRAQIPNHMRFISTSNNFTLKMIVTVIVIDCFELWPLLLICKLSHNNTQISRWAHDSHGYFVDSNDSFFAYASSKFKHRYVLVQWKVISAQNQHKIQWTLDIIRMMLHELTRFDKQNLSSIIVRSLSPISNSHGKIHFVWSSSDYFHFSSWN